MATQELTPLQVLDAVASDSETAIRTLREGITRVQETNDYGTDDLLSGIIRDLEKDVWMLRAHLNHIQEQ